MDRLRIVFFKFLIITILLNACSKTNTQDLPALEKELNQIVKSIIPDKRVGIAEYELLEENGGTKLLLKTNKTAVIDKVRTFLKESELQLDTNFQLLPNKAKLANKVHAVVNISVANIRSKPKHSAELATQATLGTPLKVLDKQGSWYRVQTPDHYISWVDAGGIQLFTDEELKTWLDAEKLIINEIYDHAYVEPKLNSPLVSDLAGGNVLKYIAQENGFWKVAFPDGRQGYVKQESAQFFEKWLADLTPTPENLVKVSKQMIGVPYLWGGTSFKGVDCSGFTKTIYFMNGMVIPRDASQQVHAGKPIDTANGFDNLQPGDLLFFGRKATNETPEKVIHVAMWLGNNEFIHSSGRVRINSFDPNSPIFNEYELNRFLRAKRYLDVPQELIMQLADSPLFYNANSDKS